MGSTGNKLYEQMMTERGYLPGEAPEEPYMPKFAQDQRYALMNEGVTPEQITWMQSQRDAGLPMDITHPLYNSQATEYLS